MSRYYCILAIVFSLFQLSSASAQTKGNVTIHSDPRLALLLNRSNTQPKPAARKKAIGNEVLVAGVAPAAGTVKNITIVKANRNNAATENVNTAATKTPEINELPGTDGPAIKTPDKKLIAANMAEKPARADRAIPVKPRPLPKANNKRGPVIFTGRGYRVQIYYGSDRTKATKIRTEFIRHFPEVQTYLTYTSPSFRVRVGDYRNRQEAAAMLKEANKINRPSMIVPDDITVTAN